MEIKPDLDTIISLSKEYNLIPIYTECLGDLETPISAFMKIYKDAKFSFLLDSVVGGERLARYSFLGGDPFCTFRSKYSLCTITENAHRKVFNHKNPIDVLKTLILKYKPYEPIYLPPFYGGAVGYFSYDAVRNIENIPNQNEDDLNLDHISFIFPNHVVTFDHVENRIKITVNLYLDGTKNSNRKIELLYNKAIVKINEIKEKLKKPIQEKAKYLHKKKTTSSNNYKASFGEEDYKKAVEKAKEYIVNGDIFQVQISRRLEIDISNIDHFSIYRALRTINPSPYLFYLKYDDIEVIGSSPELLVKKEGRKIISRPIAGTRRRGRTQEDEIKMEDELRNDEKERAEHIMLVDLGRNDLGKVCDFASVKIAKDGIYDKLMYFEKYSHVMHLVSEIEGRLSSGKDAFDAFLSSFPAGTLTGAPKIRAMEIIEELEPVKRGLYGGGVTYFNFDGNMDSCIIIRTIIIKNNTAYIQTAGGVVYDSIPKLEFMETKNKAQAMLNAIEYAFKIDNNEAI